MASLACHKCHATGPGTVVFSENGTTWCERCHAYNIEIEKLKLQIKYFGRKLSDIDWQLDLITPDCYYCVNEREERASKSFWSAVWVAFTSPSLATHLTADCTVVCDSHLDGEEFDMEALVEECKLLQENAPWVVK